MIWCLFSHHCWWRQLMFVVCACLLQCQYFKYGQARGDGASAERSPAREEQPPRIQGHYWSNPPFVSTVSDFGRDDIHSTSAYMCSLYLVATFPLFLRSKRWRWETRLWMRRGKEERTWRKGCRRRPADGRNSSTGRWNWEKSRGHR